MKNLYYRDVMCSLSCIPRYAFWCGKQTGFANMNEQHGWIIYRLLFWRIYRVTKVAFKVKCL